MVDYWVDNHHFPAGFPPCRATVTPRAVQRRRHGAALRRAVEPRGRRETSQTAAAMPGVGAGSDAEPWENVGKMLGKCWENVGKCGKMLRKCWEHVGKMWENVGKMLENVGKMLGKC